jgi:trimethylamine:corrinoid methyltransferase-like protein
MEWLSKEIFNPSDLVDRQELSVWKKLGSKDTVQRAREIAQRILREHKPEPLPADAERTLDDVTRKIMKKHGVDRLPLGPA